MTMKELAKKANVSISAISKAFNDAPDISEETKKHIFEVAKEYGCYNKFYKGKYPKPIIALICPEINSPHYSLYIQLFQEIIEASGAIMLVSSYDFDADKQLELVDYYSSYLQVDGIIVFNLKEVPKSLSDTPIISLGVSKTDNVDSVSFDPLPATLKAIKLLKDLGHTHFAYAGETLTHAAAESFKMILPPIKNANCIFESSKRFEEAGIDCAEQILASGVPFTAIFCAYDEIAMGVMKHLTERGYKIPEDFSVIGKNNIEISSYLETALTTIDSHYKKVCSSAWKLLQKKMKNKYYKNAEPTIFTSELIVRDSIGKAKK